MDSIAPALNRACEILEGFIGTIGTILTVALGFGLLFLCSFGFRFTVLKAWVQAQDYLTKYFNRLRRYGLTRVGSRIAVACGLIVWSAIILGFAFEERLVEALILSLLTLLATFAWSWLERGPRARLPKFTRGFLEPTLALAVPTFVGKSGDFIFQFIVRSIKAVL